MSKPFPMQVLLDLAHEGRDSAAASLGAANRDRTAQQQRLQLLLDYRHEYQRKLADAAQGGVAGLGLLNYRAFIERIDAAIEQQRLLLARAASEVEDQQRRWLEQQRKLKSFDALSHRHAASERRHEARREQKAQDDFAIKGFLGRMALG
jgi:flagellar FliJ protein